MLRLGLTRRPRGIKYAASTVGLGAAAVVLNEKPREKLPIYPQEEPPVTLITTPLPLEEHIRTARLAVTSTYLDAHRSVQGVVDHWIGFERGVEDRVKSIVSSTEPLTPGILYVGVTTLSGSIFTRTRALPARILLPPTLLVLSLNHFLPQTTANLSAYLTGLEEHYLPGIAQKQAVAVAHTQMGWEMAKDKARDVRVRVERGALTVVEWSESVSGLRLGETFGLGRKAGRDVVVSEPVKVGIEKTVGETTAHQSSSPDGEAKAQKTEQ
jgi:organizing structure protein 2